MTYNAFKTKQNETKNLRTECLARFAGVKHPRASLILNSVLPMLVVLTSVAFPKESVPLVYEAERNSLNSLSYKYASNRDLKQMDGEPS